MSVRAQVTLIALAVVASTLLRLPGLGAAYPYLAYVDEGHLLHPVRELFRDGHWDPAKNNYPALPVYGIAAAAWLGDHALPSWSGRLASELPRGFTYYDVIEPSELLLAGRLASLLMSAAIVALVALLGLRLGGAVAATVAAVAAALLPALVARGALVMVDLYATALVLAAALLVAGAVRPEQWGRLAAAGACCGLAAVCKYPAGLAGLGLAAAVALAPWSLGERLRALAAATGSAVVAAVVGMPALVTQPVAVWQRVRWQGEMYRTLRSPTSYWQQTFGRAEWDLPLDAPEIGWGFASWAVAGWVLLALRPATRRFAAGAAALMAALLALHVGYPFQAFRNLLPLAGLACVAAGCAAGALAERLRRQWVVGGLGVLLLSALFLAADWRWARGRLALRDSRVEAVDWVVARAKQGRGPGGPRVLVQDELAMVSGQLARLGERAESSPWSVARGSALAGLPGALVLGDLVGADGTPLIAAEDRRALRRRYRRRAVFGEQTVSAESWAWRGNRQRVTVWERKGGSWAGGGERSPSSPEAAAVDDTLSAVETASP